MDIRSAFIERRLKQKFQTLQNTLELANYPTWLKVNEIDFEAQREAPSAALSVEFPKYKRKVWLYVGRIDNREELDKVMLKFSSEFNAAIATGTNPQTYSPRWH